MAELWRLDARDLAAGYRRGDFSPGEALEACLARVAACQPVLNMMAVVDAAGAREAAAESGRRWAEGQPLGPLDGVPVSVKDNLHVAGLPTGWGGRLLEGFVAAQDEVPVARLRAGGAILYAKTNLPEFAMQGYTANAVAGVTRNPWRPELTPGGSSGGAVAAVAAGCGPLALATDGGGSIRRPASHCGLFGFKPSLGLVPRGGGLPEIFLDYEAAGGIGRTLADVVGLTSALAGRGLDRGEPPARMRILYAPRFGSNPVDAGVAAEIRAVAGRFATLGCDVEEGPFDLAERVNALWPVVSAAGLAWMVDRAGSFAEFDHAPGGGFDAAILGPAAQAALRDGRAASAATLFEAMSAVAELKRRLDELFRRHDVILTPATAALPWPADETHPPVIADEAVGPRGHAVFTGFANAAGLPALAAPSGFVSGLPTGFQLVGPPGGDAAVLALARRYDEIHPWRPAWPDPAGHAIGAAGVETGGLRRAPDR